MVRINLINPHCLANQHLIAEYDEILMLLGYVRRTKVIKGIPERFCLGKGHIKFFSNKITYLKKRHEAIKREMKKRGFATNKTIDLNEFDKDIQNDWNHGPMDVKIIKERITAKLRLKPEYYRYYSEYKKTEFFIGLIESA
jgi:deoxyribonuclease (pyrimidine dimer)